MGAVALDVGAGAGVSKTNANARKLRNRKHFGNASSHFLEATAAKENRLRNRVTVSNNSISRNNSNRANHGRNASLNRSK
jgi:hypothetical protein